MDNYTKMCEKANLPWEPKVGDWTDKGPVVKEFLFLKNGPKNVGVYEEKHKTFQIYLRKQLVFKPSIEQLMGMVPDRCEFELGRDVLKKNTVKAFFVVIDDGFPLFNGTSPQEALIQAVMHEKFSKKWSGDEWVKK